MTKLFVAGDISKGYADFTFLDDSGQYLSESTRLDDTPRGHQRMAETLEALEQKLGPLRFSVGVEATGGLERNWLALFRDLGQRHNILLYQINPLKVHKFGEQVLHRTVTDAHSSRTIAQFLRVGQNLGKPYEPKLQDELSFYRSICNHVTRLGAMKAELQQALTTAHPGLIQYSRDGLADWLLKLLTKWPTAHKLSKAKPEVVAKIPYVTTDKAARLVSDAQVSIGCAQSRGAEFLVESLASEILTLASKIECWKSELSKMLAEDQVFLILKSLPGVGSWTAIALRLELGDFSRFPSESALVAFVGLDPTPKMSGDGVRRLGISKRGPAELRALLFMSALVSLRVSPVFRAFYDRLRAKGKGHLPALVACMAKLLRVAYGCVRAGKAYEIQYHLEQCGREHKPAHPNPGLPRAEGEEPDLQAPVSRQEKKKREAAMPQTSSTRQNVVQAASQSQHTQLSGAHQVRRT